MTERKTAEEALRESEARHAFLLALSDAVRPLSDPVEIQTAACRVAGEHLGVGSVQYSELDFVRRGICTARDRGDMPSHAGEHPMDLFRRKSRRGRRDASSRSAAWRTPTR